MTTWKIIPDTDDKYAISTNGQVKRVAHTTRRGYTKVPDKILLGRIHYNGYVQVKVNKRLHLMHRLVASAFLPNPENKRCVNHIDFDRANNVLSNLEWVTYAENFNHSMRNGRQSAFGKNYQVGLLKGAIKRRKLKPSDVLYIRESAKKSKELAMIFNVDVSCIYRVRRMEIYKVPDLSTLIHPMEL